MARQVVSKRQRQFLKLFASSSLAKSFYFTGGTALSYFYLQHRYSEDLDFFNQKEFELQPIEVWLKTVKGNLKYISIDVQTSFNRNIFQLRFPRGQFLKLEFTYYPFVQVNKPLLKQGLLVDSWLDIAVNKLFVLNQNPRGRDYYDLYMILKRRKVELEELRMLAKQKFDWHVDPLQLGAKFNQVDEYLDDPIVTKMVDKQKVVSLFKREARRFKQEIISS